MGVTPLTTDSTPLKFNKIFNEKQFNNTLKPAFIITQENLNGITNLTEQDIQTLSHFANEQKFEALVTTTQQNISTNIERLRCQTTQISSRCWR